VKRGIDEQIAECQQQIALYDEERKALDEELGKILEEDKVFLKRFVCRTFWKKLSLFYI